jgi:hypothetical protein
MPYSTITNPNIHAYSPGKERGTSTPAITSTPTSITADDATSTAKRKTFLVSIFTGDRKLYERRLACPSISGVKKIGKATDITFPLILRPVRFALHRQSTELSAPPALRLLR